MMDRRRINGPPGGTNPPIFARRDETLDNIRQRRTRAPNMLRKMFLKTGVTPSASGSAYLELTAPKESTLSTSSLASLSTSGLKLTCTVHGPRPLPRSAPFSPHIILSTHVKYAPFATRKRRGYLRDASEKDLGVQLETALRGVIIGDRWPKSGMEVIITILEGEEDHWWSKYNQRRTTSPSDWGMMSVLSGCVTVASAAIVDAGIDCIDMVSGGVAAIVKENHSPPILVLDPVPSEHQDILAACMVAYVPSRNEVTNLWVKGDLNSKTITSALGSTYEELMDSATQAALGSYRILVSALKETADMKMSLS
ncbi:Exosome complex component MTR3 [Golovinomyces cichoracearum]|uniref:Exosome complex component MTR3 n=1 Tax=Golovinomyces cichoracearum TaxID=62708 RepID=A0A420HVT2_9PEZI|nr:Exosome complex component MTR3 [Golovinomyces cichoracearum]